MLTTLFPGLRQGPVPSNGPKRVLSVRSHLILFALATLLPVLIFAGVMFWQHVKLQRAAVDHRMTDTARALSLAVDRELGQARAIIETLAASRYLDAKDFKAFYELSSTAAKQRKGSWIVLFDPSGQQILNTLRPFGAALPNSLREAKETPVENRDGLRLGDPETLERLAHGEPIVSDLFIGTVSKQPVLSIALPVTRKGKVAYLLAMVISPQSFNALLLEQRLPSNWMGLIVDSKGMIISRQPDPEKFLGRPLSKRLKALLADTNVDEGWGEGRTSYGVDVYRSFSQSKLSRWAVVVGAPQAVIDAPVKRAVVILGAGAAGFILLAVSVALILGTQIAAPLVSLARSAEVLLHGKKVELEPSSVREVVELRSEFIRSVDERQQLEQELRQAQKLEAIGTLAGGIAHDFNNTLNIIRAYALLIGRQASGDQRIVENTRIIDEEVQRGAAVVRQLMTIARKAEPSLVSTDINQLVLTVSELIRQTFPRTIEVKLKLDRTPSSVLADANQIIQALLNICLNARDAMSQGGELTLATELIDSETLLERHPEAPASPHVCITITDTGPGMDESVRSRAFEPFFTTKSVGEGTGLGLAMVYGIVKNHDGVVDLDSEPGVGTTVRLYLPAASREDIRSTSDGSADAIVPGRNPAEASTILVVEDEGVMAHLLRDGLSQQGYNVLVATDGAEAIEVYRRHRQEVNLVLIDLGLPKVAGVEVIRAIKELNQDVKMIVTTGYLQPELKKELLTTGVNDYFQKPYMIPDIVKSIAHHLAAAELPAEPGHPLN